MSIRTLLLAVGAVCGIPLLVLVAASAFFLSFTNLDKDRQIAGPLTVSSQWVELTPSQPLQPSRQRQMIELKMSQPFAPLAIHDFRRMVLINSNTIISPEVELIDEYGNIFRLETVSDYPRPSTFEGRMSFSTRHDLPQDREYHKVRIRSDYPFHCESVMWHCHAGK